MVGKEIDQLLSRMSRREVLALIERMVEDLRERAEAGQERSLEGVLRGIADPDFDIDTALSEIRMSWQKDMADIT